MSQIVEKCSISQCRRNLQIFFRSGWLPHFNHLFVYRYVCGKIFMKIRSVVST